MYCFPTRTRYRTLAYCLDTTVGRVGILVVRFRSPHCVPSNFVCGNILLLLDLLRLLTWDINGITPMHDMSVSCSSYHWRRVIIRWHQYCTPQHGWWWPSPPSHCVFIGVGTTMDDVDVILSSIVRNKQTLVSFVTTRSPWCFLREKKKVTSIRLVNRNTHHWCTEAQNRSHTEVAHY